LLPDAPTCDQLIAENTRLKQGNAALARYLNPELVRNLDRPAGLVAGVRSLLATILFVDIRGFSELTERLSPVETLDLLDEFFTLSVSCVDRHGGTVDKLLGDGLMATFGVPLPRADDADRAVETAICMLCDILAWNRRRQAAGRPTVRIGIGIDTDVVLAGTMGAPARMDYTVIGDAVNVAAKLQQAGDCYGSPVLISRRTCNRLVREHKLADAGIVSIGRRGRQVAAHRVLIDLPHAGCDRENIAA
jgi:adenylate cyclase